MAKKDTPGPCNEWDAKWNPMCKKDDPKPPTKLGKNDNPADQCNDWAAKFNPMCKKDDPKQLQDAPVPAPCNEWEKVRIFGPNYKKTLLSNLM